MNERIAKLYEQAIVLEGNGDYVAGELDPEKFAELIVRECAELATREYDQHGAIHGRDLLDHFGLDN